MGLSELLKTLVTILVPVLTFVGSLIGIGGRRQRLRKSVRENLELMAEVEKDVYLKDFSLPASWLRSRITLDVARLTGQRLGPNKKPIPKGALVLALMLFVGFGGLTWLIDRNGFVWYSVFPAAAAFLTLLSIWGMTLNREISPDVLPAGATALADDNHAEQISASFALAASGQLRGPQSVADQSEVVIEFIRRAESGNYRSALELAEPSWFLCRLQAWVWSNRGTFGDSAEGLHSVVDQIMEEDDDGETWTQFLVSETQQFASAWGGDRPLSESAVARKRRRLSEDCDMVILVPDAPAPGYFVHSATAIPNTITFIVRQTPDGWKVVNHMGYAPATPGMPPVWWTPSDTTWNDLAQTEYEKGQSEIADEIE